jgi:diguanylate cyclase (GGDEF)-like protein
MLHRSKNDRPSGEKPIPRRTTEVHLETQDGADAVGRAQTHEPALIMLEGDLPGQVFRLRPGRQVIGRRPECDIRVRERAVSGTHAELTRVGDDVVIKDLDSTNGTLVNGLKVEDTASLLAGNIVKLGNCVFKFVDSLLEVEFTEALHSRGITDQLTGAYNRHYLVARLGFAIDLATEARPVSVIAFDYDNFKLVNDAHGHAAGDHILRETSAMISSSFIRPSDVFARMGGEEFAIALPETSLATAVDIAERIRRTLEARTFDFHGETIRLTASFGVCSATTPVEQPEALLLRADELLYRSKREGRNRVSA